MSKNTLDSILSQYEKNTDNNGSKPKISNEERLKKYFTEKLQKGVKNATKIFRILPGKDGNSPFDEAYFHERQVNGKYEKIYCPKLNGGDHCPLCEAREALLMEGSKKAHNYRRYAQLAETFFEEGIVGQVPHAGSIYDKFPTIKQMIRSGMATAGCRTIDELHQDAILELQSPVSLQDSGIHDIVATQSTQDF